MRMGIRTVLFSVCAGAGALAASGPAFAAVFSDATSSDGSQSSYGKWTNSEGNSTVGNHDFAASTEAASWVPNYNAAFAGQSQNANVSAAGFLTDGVTIFGTDYSALQLITTATANMAGSLAAPSSMGANSNAIFFVFGQQVATPTRPSTCPSFAKCSSINFNISKTLASGSQTFTVGIVPINVSASVAIGANASLSAFAVAVGSADQFVGQPSQSLTAGGSLIGNFSASVGISGVLAFGVTGQFKLISVSYNSSSSQQLAIRPTSAQDSWSNTAAFSMTSMNGKVTAWAQLSPLYMPSTDLVSVPGFNIASASLVNTGSNRVVYP